MGSSLSGRHPLLAGGVLLCLLLAGCSGKAGAERPTVHAAASLVQPMEAAAAAWAARDHPRPVLTFGSTSSLARQIERGAPADLFVAAHPGWMDRLGEADRIVEASRATLLTNRLVVGIPADRRDDPSTLPDLLDPTLHPVAIAAEGVPAGIYARQALRSAGILEELRPALVPAFDARATLALVEEGEAGAGLVYRTDALASDRVRPGHLVPADLHDPIRYPAALCRGGRAPAGARAFLAFLRGPEGRAIFEDAGFGTAPPPTPSPGGTGLDATVTLDVGTAIGLSLQAGLLAALLALVPGVAAGWLLARVEFPGKTLFTTLCLLPLVLPPVVLGYILLEILGRGGLLGPVLGTLGLRIPFTFAGAVVAAAVAGFPFVVTASRLAVEGIDPRLEGIARTLGASRLGAFARVTLPLALPGIVAGTVLAFARGLGEFGITAILAGNVEGRTRTISLAAYTLLEAPGDDPRLLWLCGAALGLCLLALAGHEALTRWQKGRTT